jgi:hypothetical protein
MLQDRSAVGDATEWGWVKEFSISHTARPESPTGRFQIPRNQNPFGQDRMGPDVFNV